MPRGTPPGGGTSRRSTPAAGAAPRGDRHRLRRRLLPRSCTYRYRLACDPAGRVGGKPLWNVDGDPVQIEWGPDLYLDYLSPAFSAATANRLGGAADIEVVCLEPVTCRPRRERHRYELLGEEEIATPVGRFSARRWRYTSLPTGWTRSLWVAGDLVVSYEGLFELAAYEPGQSGPFPR